MERARNEKFAVGAFNLDNQETLIAVSKAAQKEIPVGRYGAVEEFANTAAFIVSARASYINGSMIRCDGGAIKSV